MEYPWRVDHPPWFRLRLEAEVKNAVQTLAATTTLVVELEIRMLPTYPDVLPELQVREGGALTESEAQLMLAKLIDTARSLLGQEMVFDIVEAARGMLEAAARKHGTSVYDERLLHVQKKANPLPAAPKMDELKRLEAQIQEELSRKHNQLTQRPEHGTKPIDGAASAKAEEIVFLEEGRRLRVEETLCDDLWPWGSTQRAVDCESHQPCLLRRLSLTHPFFATWGGKRRLDVFIRGLRETAASLATATHPNLCRTVAVELKQLHTDQSELEELDECGIELEIVNELHTASRLHTIVSVLEQAGSVSLARAQVFIFQTAQGLQHLHSHGILHRDISPWTVCLTERLDVQIVDWMTSRFLRDLSTELEGFGPKIPLVPSQWSDAWTAPERRNHRPNVANKKIDVWSLGRLALQLLTGLECSAVFATPAACLDSLRTSGLAASWIEMLTALLSAEPAQRPTVDELLRFSVFTGSDSSPSRLLVSAFKNGSQVTVSGANQAPLPAPSPHPRGSVSRYHSDFEELEFLGRGGFGSVVKARNKIDDRFYAIKKVALDASNIENNRKILREVTTLSRLHHERVIRYYQAWIEELQNEKDHTDAATATVTATATMNELSTALPNRMLDLTIGRPKHQANRFEGLNDLIVFAADTDAETGTGTEPETDTDCEVSDASSATGFWQSVTSSTGNFTEKTLSSMPLQMSPPLASTATNNNPPSKGQCLYIQMEFCPNQTLRDLIDEQNSNASGRLPELEIWRLFRQIVEGLVHIHAQGMMHRDLKPSNIFLDSNGDVKIGDFGLAIAKLDSDISAAAGPSTPPLASASMAAPLVTSKAGASQSLALAEGSSLTLNIGTPFYVSPEQQNSEAVPGHRAIRYNQKVDMYALGIILLEMWCPFGTGMERIQALRAARLPETSLPSSEQLPSLQAARLIRQLLNHDPKLRPSSAELLESGSDWLPAPQEDENIEAAIRRLVQPSSSTYPKLVRSLFSAQRKTAVPENRPKDVAYDVGSGNETSFAPWLAIEALRRSLEAVFASHCAVELKPPLLSIAYRDDQMGRDAIRKREKDISGAGDLVQFIDNLGQLVQLPADLTRPLARWIAQAQVPSARRFTIDRVFAQTRAAGSQPRQSIEASFDLVETCTDTDPSKTGELAVLMAMEVIRVALEGVGSLSASGALSHSQGTLILRIGHTAVRDAVLAATGVELAALASMAIPSTPGPWCKSQTFMAKLTGTNSAALAKLNRLLGASDDLANPEEAIHRLLARLPSNSAASAGFHELNQLLRLLNVATKCRVAFEPLIFLPEPMGSVYRSGLIFAVQTLHVHAKRLPSTDTLAYGGNFSSLIESFQLPSTLLHRTNNTGLLAWGMTLSLSKSIQNDLRVARPMLPAGKPGVLVMMNSEFVARPLFTARLLDLLWSANVRMLPFWCPVLSGGSSEHHSHVHQKALNVLLMNWCSAFNLTHVIVGLEVTEQMQEDAVDAPCLLKLRSVQKEKRGSETTVLLSLSSLLDELNEAKDLGPSNNSNSAALLASNSSEPIDHVHHHHHDPVTVYLWSTEGDDVSTSSTSGSFASSSASGSRRLPRLLKEKALKACTPFIGALRRGPVSIFVHDLSREQLFRILGSVSSGGEAGGLGSDDRALLAKWRTLGHRVIAATNESERGSGVGRDVHLPLPLFLYNHQSGQVDVHFLNR